MAYSKQSITYLGTFMSVFNSLNSKLPKMKVIIQSSICDKGLLLIDCLEYVSIMVLDHQNMGIDTPIVVCPCLVAEIMRKLEIGQPFCLCKLDSQKRKISPGNRVNRIQHAQIKLRSLVPNFYPKMPLTPYPGPFSRNPASLFCDEALHLSL